MTQWFAFDAAESRTLYGFGTADEAQAYADHLNEGHAVHAYAARPLGANEVQALPELEAKGVDLRQAIETLDMEGGVD